MIFDSDKWCYHDDIDILVWGVALKYIILYLTTLFYMSI